MIKVFTLNIWAYAEPYTERMQLIRDWVEEEKPDLLAFQEAGFREGADQIRDLLAGLDYHIFHQLDDDRGEQNEGTCIASRWPINKKTVCSLMLSPNSMGYPYAAIAVRIEAPEPIGGFLFVCSKPSWELNREYERELQALKVVKLIEDETNAADFPTILAGDFDAVANSASVRFLKGKQSLDGHSTHYLDAWEQAGDGTEGFTWTYENESARGIIDACIRQKNHARRIDYVFLASPHVHAKAALIENCRVVLNKAVNGVWPSDHFGVCAEIDLMGS